MIGLIVLGESTEDYSSAKRYDALPAMAQALRAECERRRAASIQALIARRNGAQS